MSDRIMLIKHGKNTTDKNTLAQGSEHITLTKDLEKLLIAAQPRLAHLARARGVALDSVEYVVQETLVEAWRKLEYLRSPDRFDAWLNGICRNVSMRWARTQGKTDHRLLTFSSLQLMQHTDINSSTLDIPDPQTLISRKSYITRILLCCSIVLWDTCLLQHARHWRCIILPNCRNARWPYAWA